MYEDLIVDNNILFFAFKHCFYEVKSMESSILNAIRSNMDKLTNAHILQYIKEINNCSKCGACSRSQWHTLSQELEFELKSRLSRMR